MLPSVLALLSAVAYGAADFLGGLATHRSNATAVVIARMNINQNTTRAMAPAGDAPGNAAST